MRGRRTEQLGLATTVALLLALATVLFVAAPSSGAPNSVNQKRLETTVRFLQEAQNLDGGFGGSRGAPSGQLFSAWVALALAAAGINPQDQAKPGGRDVYSFLVSNYRRGITESDCAPVACTTTLERELMVVNAAGTSPRDYAGVDLVAELLGRARPDGSFPHVPGGQPGVNDTIFAIFALAPVEDAAAREAIASAANWVESAQQSVGGWAWRAGNAPDEVDMTGAAIQALVAAGRPGNEAVRDGLAYLRRAQNPDGGFPMFPGEAESNSASTCWAVQAIWAAGENPEAWVTRSGRATEEPLDYLESLQAADGHIRWKTSNDLNGIWMTAYCAPAFAGQAWPIPDPPRSGKSTEPPAAGEGGGDQSGSGVLAAGGGSGAPLFSRPKPQSKGKTPGGARVLEGEKAKPRNHSRTRRGENTEQATATQAREARSASEAAAPGEGPAIGAGSGAGLGSGSKGPPSAGGGSSGNGPGSGASGAGAGGGGVLPAGLAAAGSTSVGGGANGERVSGTVIGSGGSLVSNLHFGAPGLHGAGIDGGDGQRAAAVVIGAAALLLALGGVGWERRRAEAIL